MRRLNLNPLKSILDQRRNSHSILNWLLLLFLLFPVQTVSAHKVMVFAEVVKNQVITSSRFFNGKPVREGNITVVDDQNQPILEGKTDESGHFAFIIPQKTPLTIILDAGSGHRATWKIPVEEIAKAPQAIDAAGQQASKTPQPPLENTVTGNGQTANEEKTYPIRELEIILDQHLSPLNAKLSRLEEAALKPDISDIAGALGYIIGLMGLWMFFKYRKRT